MKTVSTSPAEPGSAPSAPSTAATGSATAGRALVWDAPVRVFHWLLALSFGGAWLTSESERWQPVHVALGYTVAGLVVFRLVWGLIGTRHARFASFVRGPAAVSRYLRSLVEGRPEHHLGHNPAGALAIVALLGLAGLVTATGWLNYAGKGGHWVEWLHELLANGMMMLVLVHVAAVVVSSRLHRENLVVAMITGRKPGRPEQGARRAWTLVALLLLAATLAFWGQRWQRMKAEQAAWRAQQAAVDGRHAGAQRGRHGHQGQAAQPTQADAHHD